MKQIDLEPTEHRRKLKAPAPFHRLWHHDPQPVFLPGAWKRIGMWLIGLIIVAALAILTYPLAIFGEWVACTYITGSCLQ